MTSRFFTFACLQLNEPSGLSGSDSMGLGTRASTKIEKVKAQDVASIETLVCLVYM